MDDIGVLVAGRPLSPEAQDLLASYSEDLLDALIDAACTETKSRNSHKINEDDLLRSIKAVSMLPARVVPRATLRIFGTSKAPTTTGCNDAPVASAFIQASSHTFCQRTNRSMRTAVDEATFLEDIRKMKPAEIKEPRLYASHKLTLDPKDIRPRVGAAAAAEVASAMERPARHFIGRPQPLITEDRGNVQPELTTYNRYRNYLGIIGPMPNIKPNVGAMMKIPAFLQALQQRNEVLAFTGANNAGSTQIPHPPPPQQSKQASPAVPRPNQQIQAPPHPPLPLHMNFPMPAGLREAIQRLKPEQAAQLYQELLQKQRRQDIVDDVERSALMSPTPPLTEPDYPLRPPKSTNKLNKQMIQGRSSYAQERLPLDDEEWNSCETPQGHLDHMDCAAYYENINPKPKLNVKAKNVDKGEGAKEDQSQRRADPENKDVNAEETVIAIPKPPPYFTPEELEKFSKRVERLQLIANLVQYD